MPFELRDHTADVLAECSGGSFKELVESAMHALYAVAVASSEPGAVESRLLRFYAYSNEEFLVRWLQELNYFLDVDRFIATSFTFEKPDDDCYLTTVTGFRATELVRETEVKAVTYHDLKVECGPKGLRVGILFDL